jgi:glycosyltransferase involved in cell wall biosynthesis
MHLLLASVSAATSPSGVCRHAANMARGMLANPSVRKVTMLVGEWQIGYFRNTFGLKGLEGERFEMRSFSIANRPAARNFWYLRALPATARACNADVVHLAFPMPLLRSAYPVPVVVSLHDLYPFDIPRNFGKHRARLNRAALKLCLKNVDAIACVSETTRTRLRELFPAVDSRKSSVVPNSVCVVSDRVELSLPDEIEDNPFLLCVAQHRANKNLPLLLQSFRLALDRGSVARESKLVIVGNEGPETQLLHRIVTDCRLEDQVVFLRDISDALLSALYAKCEIVVAPSLLEGFGLPVAEALAAGCRVACSEIAEFRITGTSSCVFFDPKDSSGESLVAALQKALKAPRSAVISSTGLAPQQAAAMYLALYSKLMLPNRTSHFKPSSADLPVSGDL